MRIKEHAHIGPVEYRKRKNAKRISISVDVKGRVKVSLPDFATYALAENFVISHTQWIVKKQSSRNQMHFVLNEYVFYPISDQLWSFITADISKRKKEIDGKKIIWHIPQEEGLSNNMLQQSMMELYIGELRIQAKKELTFTTIQLAEKYGFSYNLIRFKNLKSRWGSCSSKGNINLNIHLLRLPKPLINYVILHELNHLKFPHHGPSFWNNLDKLCDGKAKYLDQQLKAFHPLKILPAHV